MQKCLFLRVNQANTRTTRLNTFTTPLLTFLLTVPRSIFVCAFEPKFTDQSKLGNLVQESWQRERSCLRGYAAVDEKYSKQMATVRE
jgi:hypothetical protein